MKVICDANGVPVALSDAAIQPPEARDLPAVDDVAKVFTEGWVWLSQGWVKLGPRPSVNHVPDESLSVWVDGRPLSVAIEQERASARARVKAARSKSEVNSFEALGKVFDGDAVAQRRIASAAMAALVATQSGVAWSVSWTLVDNSEVDLSAQEMLYVAAALWMRTKGLHEWATELRAQIDSTTSPEQLRAICR